MAENVRFKETREALDRNTVVKCSIYSFFPLEQSWISRRRREVLGWLQEDDQFVQEDEPGDDPAISHHNKLHIARA